MATTTQIAAPVRAASPLALWHLLSLDAPTVATLWTWFIAQASGVRLPAASIIAMALAVWILYAADRLLDAGLAHNDEAERAELEARHLFHDQYRSAFVAGILVASIVLGGLLPLLDAAALRLYLVEGALLAAWFVLLHAMRAAHRMPKEIAVGFFFSAAVFIPTVAREPGLRLQLAPAVVLLGAVCALNCLFIYAWEHEGMRPAHAREAHPTTRLAVQYLRPLAPAMAAAAILFAIAAPSAGRSLFTACVLSIAALLLIDRCRTRLSRIHLRAMADVALLSPLLLLVVRP